MMVTRVPKAFRRFPVFLLLASNDLGALGSRLKGDRSARLFKPKAPNPELQRTPFEKNALENSNLRTPFKQNAVKPKKLRIATLWPPCCKSVTSCVSVGSTTRIWQLSYY